MKEDIKYGYYAVAFIDILGQKDVFNQLNNIDFDDKRETKEAGQALHRAVELLKKDIKSHIRLLEKVKLRRQLTEEEDKIIRQMNSDLNDVEKYIGKEIEDIEKEVK